MLRKDDGSIVIIDHKTAKLSKAQEALVPVYSVQLNSYAWIAERCGLGPVSEVGLVYFEPQTIKSPDDLSQSMSEDGLDLVFRPTSLPLLLNMRSIPPLLQRVRSIADLDEPLPATESCKDCQALDAIQRFTGDGEAA